MKHPLFYLALLLPQLAAAQVIRHIEVGSYVLRAEPGKAHQAGLYLPNGQQLVVRDLGDRTQTLTPAEVSSFQLPGRRFVATSGFAISESPGYVARAFAEQLDSGRVVLLRYTSGPGATMSPSGALIYGGPPSSTVYLLRLGSTPDAALTAVPDNWSRRNPQLLAALRPYLAARPDLLQLLESKQLSTKQLPEIVHALNSGQPLMGAGR